MPPRVLGSPGLEGELRLALGHPMKVVFGSEKHGSVPAEDLMRLIPEDPLGARVPGFDVPAETEVKYGVIHGGLEEQPVTFLVHAEARLLHDDSVDHGASDGTELSSRLRLTPAVTWIPTPGKKLPMREEHM